MILLLASSSLAGNHYGCLQNWHAQASAASVSTCTDAGSVTIDLDSPDGKASLDLKPGTPYSNHAWGMALDFSTKATIRVGTKSGSDTYTIGAGDDGFFRFVDSCGVVCGSGNTCGGCTGDKADITPTDLLVFETLDGSYEVVATFEGADVDQIEEAELSQTTRTADVTTCDKRGCVTTPGKETTVSALSDGGAVHDRWSADYPDGKVPTEWTVTVYDTEGKRLEHQKGEVTLPYEDGADGVPAVPLEGDPLTTVALTRQYTYLDRDDYPFVVVSDGWSLDEAPAYAEVALDGGETWDIPANSYQVATNFAVLFSGIKGGKCDADDDSYLVSVNGTPITGYAYGDRGLCGGGYCAFLDQDADGAWSVGVTAYAADPTDLPASVKVSLTSKGGCDTTEEAYVATFDDTVAAVYAQWLSFDGSPVDLGITGEIGLYSLERGRAKFHASRAKFHTSAMVVPGSGLGFGGIDEVDADRGDILIGGEPIGFELTKDLDGDGIVAAPPAILRMNGTGTRQASASTSQTQQTQLL